MGGTRLQCFPDKLGTWGSSMNSQNYEEPVTLIFRENRFFREEEMMEDDLRF